MLSSQPLEGGGGHEDEKARVRNRPIRFINSYIVIKRYSLEVSIGYATSLWLRSWGTRWLIDPILNCGEGD